MLRSRGWNNALRAVGIAAAVVGLWVTFRDVNVKAVEQLLSGIGPLATLALLPHIVWLGSETAGWRWALSRIGRQVPFWRLLRVRLSTEAINLTLPAGVVLCESLTPPLLYRHCKVPLTEGVASIAARKFLLLASQATYVFLIFVFGFPYFRLVSSRLIGGSGLQWIPLGVSLLLALLAAGVRLTLLHGAIVARVHSVLARMTFGSWRGWLNQRRGGFVEADEHVVRFFESRTRDLTGPAAYFLLCWIIESFETWILLTIIGVDLPFMAVASAEVMVVFMRHVLFVLPAGLGVQEAGYAAFLMAFGVKDPVAACAAFVLLKRAKELFWAIGGYSLLVADRQSVPARASGQVDDIGEEGSEAI